MAHQPCVVCISKLRLRKFSAPLLALPSFPFVGNFFEKRLYVAYASRWPAWWPPAHWQRNRAEQIYLNERAKTGEHCNRMDAPPSQVPTVDVRSFEVDDGSTCRYITSVLRRPGDHLEVAVRWSEMVTVVRELRELHPEIPGTLVLPRYFFKTTDSAKLEQRRQELNHFWTGLIEWLVHNENASAQGLLDTPPLQRMLAGATQIRAARKLQEPARGAIAVLPALATEQDAQDPGPLPVHLCGRYTHDDRSDDWEPVLEAMGLPWLVRKVGRYLNPDVELYFTQTHFNVWGSTALGPNTDSFPLTGKEERLADMNEGSPVEEPMSYMCQTDGRSIKTWSWVWHADGKSKKWLTTSERYLEGPEPPSLSSPSFHERVAFYILDEPDRPPIRLSRYMVRDSRHPPQFPLPPSIAARAWRLDDEAPLDPEPEPAPAPEPEPEPQPQPQPQPQPVDGPQGDWVLPALRRCDLRHRSRRCHDMGACGADGTYDDAGTAANTFDSSQRSACTCNPDDGLYVLKLISRHLAAAAVGATFAALATAVVRAYGLHTVVTT
jgi:hypothetical protein